MDTVPDLIIEFKREVYEQDVAEFSRLLAPPSR